MLKLEDVTRKHLETVADLYPSIKEQMDNGFQLDNLRWGILRDQVLYADGIRPENEIQPSKVSILARFKSLWNLEC